MEESISMKSEQMDEGEISYSNLKIHSTNVSSTSVTENDEWIIDFTNDDSFVTDFSKSKNENKLPLRTSCQRTSDRVTDTNLESRLLKIHIKDDYSYDDSLVIDFSESKNECESSSTTACQGTPDRVIDYDSESEFLIVDDKDDINDYNITKEDDILLLNETLLSTNPSNINYLQINCNNTSTVNANCISEDEDIKNITDEIKESTNYKNDGYYKEIIEDENKINAKVHYVPEDIEILNKIIKRNTNFNYNSEEKEFSVDNQIKTNEVSETDGGKAFCLDEQISGSMESFSNKLSFEPTKMLNTSTNYNSATSSTEKSTFQINNSTCHEGLEINENTLCDGIRGKTQITEVMNSSIDRRCHIDLLKKKTKSLFATYNKYASDFSQISLENSNEALLSPKHLKNLSSKSIQNFEKKDAESIKKNTDLISAYKHSPFTTRVQKAKEELRKSPFVIHIKKEVENDTQQQSTLKANQVVLESKKSDIAIDGQAPSYCGKTVPHVSEKSILSSPKPRTDKMIENVCMEPHKMSAYEHSPFTARVQKAKEEFFESPFVIHFKREIENDTQKQSTLKANQVVLESKKSDIAIEGQAPSYCGKTVPHVSEESILSSPKPRKDKIIENVCMEQQQDVSNKNHHSSEASEKRNEIFSTESEISESITDTKNKKTQQVQGKKYTEILNSTLYVEPETEDFHDTQMDTSTVFCSRCKKSIADEDDSYALESKSGSEECVTRNDINRSEINVSLQALLELLSIDNTVSQNILLALSSEQFKKGACLTDIIKYLNQKKVAKTSIKLKQDVKNFLNAAETTHIIKMKNRRYCLDVKRLPCDQKQQSTDTGNKLTNTTKISQPKCHQRKMTLRETTQRKIILEKIKDAKI